MLASPAGFEMLYVGGFWQGSNDGLGFAASVDGIQWTSCFASSVFAAPPGVILGVPAALRRADQFVLAWTALLGNGKAGVRFATAPARFATSGAPCGQPPLLLDGIGQPEGRGWLSVAAVDAGPGHPVLIGFGADLAPSPTPLPIGCDLLIGSLFPGASFFVADAAGSVRFRLPLPILPGVAALQAFVDRGSGFAASNALRARW